MRSSLLCFDNFVLDTEHFELRKNDITCTIEPMVFDLLVHFARHPDQIFSHDDLIAAVWSGRVVSDATVATCIKNARRALGDSGSAQIYIQTVRGRGFRFKADVEDSEDRPEPPETSLRTVADSAATDPALLILPFQAVNAETSDGFCTGLSADIGTVLTRIPLLQLRSPDSHCQGSSGALPLREIHRNLGVDYVLQGTVQTLDDQARINVKLFDARCGVQIWAEKIAVSGSDQELMDRSVHAIVAKLEPQLHRSIYQTIVAGDKSDARQFYLQAHALLALKGWHHDTFDEAAELLRHCWTLEPRFALAPAGFALVTGLGQRLGLMARPEQVRSEALTAADCALELDSMDSTVLGFAGCALADIGYYERANGILSRAIELNPANAQAWSALGAACIPQRRLQEAIQHLQHGISISPRDSRLTVWGTMLAQALRMSGDVAAACEQAELACRRDDRSYLSRVVYASLLLDTGNKEAARRVLADAYRVNSHLTASQIRVLVGREATDRLLQLKP